ncbi:MAG: hypothetical protein H6740_26785 [Alphaproteobacteria bacterium]|nr:hypothetical protein [Alphaproteobacteria bacterium]
MSPRCRDVDALLALELPLSAEPLPAALAAHVEECHHCSSAFDAHFKPVRFAPVPAPPELRQEWLKPRPALGPIALAAAALLIGLSMPEPPSASASPSGPLPVSLIEPDETLGQDTCELEPEALRECVIEQS